MRRSLLAGAIVLLAVAFIGKAVDAFSERTVDILAVAGLGFLVVGQALRAWADRSRRSLLVLLLVLALSAIVLFDSV